MCVTFYFHVLYIYVLYTGVNPLACLSKLHILEMDQEIKTLDCSSPESCRCVCVCVCVCVFRWL